MAAWHHPSHIGSSTMQSHHFLHTLVKILLLKLHIGQCVKQDQTQTAMLRKALRTGLSPPGPTNLYLGTAPYFPTVRTPARKAAAYEWLGALAAGPIQTEALKSPAAVAQCQLGEHRQGNWRLWGTEAQCARRMHRHIGQPAEPPDHGYAKFGRPAMAEI